MSSPLVFDRAPTIEAFADRAAEADAQQRILALARDGASLADACETMVPRLSITVVAWWTRHDAAFQQALDKIRYPALAPHGPRTARATRWCPWHTCPSRSAARGVR